MLFSFIDSKMFKVLLLFIVYLQFSDTKLIILDFLLNSLMKTVKSNLPSANCHVFFYE